MTKTKQGENISY